MKQISEMSELLETGLYQTYSPPERMTVQQIIEKLGLKGQYWGILLNGKNVALDTFVEEDDEFVILPKIAGG